MILNGGYLKRVVIPSAKVTAVGDITYVDGQPIGYEVTLSAAPDSSGNTHYEYLAASTETQSQNNPESQQEVVA